MSQLDLNLGIQAPDAIFYARTDAERLQARDRYLPDAATPVLVVSNGSGEVQPLEALFEALATHTLDPKFRRYGNFRLESQTPARVEQVEFWGNFHDVSHVFCVRCVAESDTARRLDAAIEANIATPAYSAACVEDDERQAVAKRGLK